MEVIPSTLLSSVDVFLFDCDGVIWKGDHLIEGAKNTISKLRERGKKLYFVTNNSTKSRLDNYKKFQSLGLEVEASEILCSSYAATLYFTQNPIAPGKKVYVIGEQGIIDELLLAKIPHIGGPTDNFKTINKDSLTSVQIDSDVGAVLVGFDSGLNYYKIQYAQLCLNCIPNCKFIATNQDQVKHLTIDQEWAGSGAMVGAIIGCTGQYPIVVGKPSSYLIDHILEIERVQRSKICMIGDRLDTDISFGINNGLQTLLVLSGVTSRNHLSSDTNKILPQYIANSIADLFPTN